MSFKPFKIVKVILPQYPDIARAINMLQDNILQALTPLLNKDFIDGVLLKNVQLLPGITNKVPHGLGRNLQGWNVTRTHGGYALLTDLQDNNPSPNLTLWLTTPAQVTVDLKVF